MVAVVYIEEAVRDHPRVERICDRFAGSKVIFCEKYTEIFNPKAQNFRLQKQNPALILARKNEGFVMKAPAAYNIGGDLNFYFSHMLNCIYDCRYCFLQGMFRSANYLLFVNYEDFSQAIASRLAEYPGDESVWFFSGYDCDSLAYEPVTHFARYFLPFFTRHPRAFLELRTKSTQIRPLLSQAPVDNAVVAFSFTPEPVSNELEFKVPAFDLRLKALQKLQQAGWRVGLRFDPLIYVSDYKKQYAELISRIFSSIEPARVHSVTLGSFRMPKDFYKTIARLYPGDALYAGPLLANDEGLVSYATDTKNEMLEYVGGLLLKSIPQSRFFNHEQVIPSVA